MCFEFAVQHSLLGNGSHHAKPCVSAKGPDVVILICDAQSIFGGADGVEESVTSIDCVVSIY